MWIGGEGSCPVGSCPAWFCKARYFKVRTGTVAWGTVERCFAWLCKVRRHLARLSTVGQSGVGLGSAKRCEVFQGEVSFWQGGAVQSEVRHSKLSLWFGEVLLSVVGLCGVRYGEALSWRGDVLRCGERFAELLCGIALRGERRHCKLVFGRALLRSGIAGYTTVESGFARLRAVRQGTLRFGCALQRVAWLCFPFFAKALFWFCDVLKGCVGQALLSLRSGVETQGSVMRGAASCCSVSSNRGLARSCRAVQAGAKLCAVFYGDLRRYFGLVMQGGVQLCTARYGNVRLQK